MTQQVQDAYIVSAVRTPVGKAPRGVFRNTRPDDLLAFAIDAALKRCPSIDKARIDDAVIGCAMPEAEQGMNVARIAVLLAGLPNVVSAVTVNRFCSSGLQAVAMAADRIRLGEADLMIGGGTESMSMVPMMGYHPVFNPGVFANENVGVAYGMGITAERSPSSGRSRATSRTRSRSQATRKPSRRRRPASSPTRSRRTRSTTAIPTSPKARSSRTTAR